MDTTITEHQRWKEHEIEARGNGQTLLEWFLATYPNIRRGLIDKHIKKRFIRVNRLKTTLNYRLTRGDVIRIHPVIFDESIRSATEPKTTRRPMTRQEEQNIRDLVIYMDDDMIAINKPAGLAVQGGSNIKRSVDDVLDALGFGTKERPRLVHRLDKDTSGVLLLARTKVSAARLTKLFRDKGLIKVYWAVVVGKPAQNQGMISIPLAKSLAPHRELVQPATSEDEGQTAQTNFELLDHASKLSWLALNPITGRTHQLRVHCAASGFPILGDGKYGGKKSFVTGLSNKLHLHAHTVYIPNYLGNKPLEISAPLPHHMEKTFHTLGFEL